MIVHKQEIPCINKRVNGLISAKQARADWTFGRIIARSANLKASAIHKVKRPPPVPGLGRLWRGRYAAPGGISVAVGPCGH
jgi:hypothetical protein